MSGLLAAKTSVDYTELSARLFADLVAIGILGYALYLRRHGRRDLLMVLTAFNVGLFAVLAVISSRHIPPGLAFGLFAILSLIRLRSEPFDNLELGYFFGSLVLALVNGLSRADYPLSLSLDALVLLTLYLVDHRALHADVRTRRVTLDGVRTDAAKLRSEMEERLGVDVTQVDITEIDDVRETTQLRVRYVNRPDAPERP